MGLKAHELHGSCISVLHFKRLVKEAYSFAWHVFVDNSMSQPDIGKVVAQKWEAVKVQSLQSLEAGCQAWATYVDPKAHELQVNLKQKMEETKRFLSEKAFSFTNHK